MKDKLKIIIGLIIIIVLIVLIGWIAYQGKNSQTEGQAHPVATFEIQDYGTVKMELYPEYAPNTVTNFISLIESGYYSDKVIYGKDNICLYMARNDSSEEDDDDAEEGPTISLIDSSIEADSDADYEYEIDGEFVANGFEQNTLRHKKGVISLNRYDYSTYGLVDEGYNSGSAQFSVMMEDSDNLDGVYCAFGKVVEGFDILEQIYNELETVSEETDEEESEAVETETVEENAEETEEVTEEDTETEEDETAMKEFASKPVITSVSVEKNGIEFGKPEVHEKFDIQSYINQLYSSYYSN